MLFSTSQVKFTKSTDTNLKLETKQRFLEQIFFYSLKALQRKRQCFKYFTKKKLVFQILQRMVALGTALRTRKKNKERGRRGLHLFLWRFYYKTRGIESQKKREHKSLLREITGAIVCEMVFLNADDAFDLDGCVDLVHPI